MKMRKSSAVKQPDRKRVVRPVHIIVLICQGFPNFLFIGTLGQFMDSLVPPKSVKNKKRSSRPQSPVFPPKIGDDQKKGLQVQRVLFFPPKIGEGQKNRVFTSTESCFTTKKVKINTFNSLSTKKVFTFKESCFSATNII